MTDSTDDKYIPEKACSLPWSVSVTRAGRTIHLSAKGIESMLYRPSFEKPWHLFRDDVLAVSYSTTVTENEKGEIQGADHIIWGADILPFLKAASFHSPRVTSSALRKLEEKLRWLESFTSSEEAP